MFFPELLYYCPQNDTSFQGKPRLAENHDSSPPRFAENNNSSQSLCPARIVKACKCGRCIYCVCQSEDDLIDSHLYEGFSGPSAYARPLNEVNRICNSLSMHHENIKGEFNSAAYFKKKDEISGVNPNERGNAFINNQDSLEEKATSFTSRHNKGKEKPRNTEIAANLSLGRKPHVGFRADRTARDIIRSRISPPSGSKDRHSKVHTLKGPRDRRIRLSVGTAIKLYCVQDMLGIENPSQAVEWLIGKSQNMIRELPQLSSISSSHISKYVEPNRAAVSVTCHQTEDLSTSTQDNTCTASGDFLMNIHEQILAAKTFIGHKPFTAMTTKSDNKHSIVHREKREQRSIAMRPVASNQKSRETASALPQIERRAKARERARERTKEKEKRCSRHNGIYGILQPSFLPPPPHEFSLQDNTTATSSLNLMNETTDGIGNSYTFLHSLMFPKDSSPFSFSRLCVSSPTAEIQVSSLADVHNSTAQQEGISIQSTEPFSSLNPELFPLTSDPFAQAVTTTNNCSSYNALCSCPPDCADLESSNLCQSYRQDSIEMPGTYNGGLDTSYEWQSSWNKESFEEFLVNEEIPGLNLSNRFSSYACFEISGIPP